MKVSAVDSDASFALSMTKYLITKCTLCTRNLF
jgi:hypothetical protein